MPNVLKRTFRVACVCPVVLFATILGATATLDIVRYRDAQRFLTAVRTIQVGSTNGRDALKVAQPFRPDVYIVKHTELPSGDSDRIVNISSGDCIAADCSLWFSADTHRRCLLLLSYPTWNCPRLRKWVPTSVMAADVTNRAWDCD
jgi:hypothetical protein